MTRVILASASPRRRELLAALLPTFEVVVSDIEEPMTEDPERDAVHLALGKATAVAGRAEFVGAVVIGADTIVHDGLKAYGKPSDPADAVAMLTALRNRTHRVFTGVAVTGGANVRAAVSVSEVTLSNHSDRAIEAYVASGRPLDKAGAYAIQDEDVPTVAALDGCFCGVMGLPLWRLRSLLDAFGVQTTAPDATYPRCAACPERDSTASFAL